MTKVEIEKLKESIPTNSMKIIDLYNKIDGGLLNTQPNYQRKLVWKKQHKYAFIDTILKNFPFPEVYIASSDIDVEEMVAKEEIVDGQQRLTTIIEYIKETGDFKNQNKVKTFSSMNSTEKKEFLNYKVSVKDLKDIGEDLTKEIFRRINSTEYSLNKAERNNATYGDGEIALFCKQLIDLELNLTEEQTDIIIDYPSRLIIYNFFNQNHIFNDNDIKRMFDFQYIMLLISTILEGDYYRRSDKVDGYLEDFNIAFPQYTIALDALLKAINFINQLGLPPKSYWFNKANLFTLLIELSKVELSNIDIIKFESSLLTLSDKVDIYFCLETEEEIENISEDEKKYFEFARQGSHEKPARDHRGKVIENIILNCKKDLESTMINNISDKYVLLDSHDIKYTIIIPTSTGLEKSILDATLPVRNFLAENNIHDYSKQGNGPESKATAAAQYIEEDKFKDLKISLYRAKKRGDTRIWFTELREHANGNDEIAILYIRNDLYIVNLTKYNLEELEETNKSFADLLK